MTQVRKILIADDDSDLRAALAEQLALHEEFAAVQAIRLPRRSASRAPSIPTS